MRWIAVMGVVALGLAACSSSSVHTAAPTTTTAPADCTPGRPAPAARPSYTIKVGNTTRSYAFAIPKRYTGTRAVPMVVLVHGYASSQKQFDAETAFDKLGAQRGYLVVTPDGASNPKTWNFISGSSGSSSDDYAFIDALVARLDKQLCVDKDRVYAAGHSAGSAFVGFLVCHKPYRFAGVAMVEATIPSSCPPSITYSVLSIHGTDDTSVLYNGGLGAGQTVPIPAVKSTIRTFAARDGCNIRPTEDRPAPGVDRLRYPHCANAERVALVTIVGGGHPWAGGLQATHAARVVPGARYSATAAILDFFDDLTRESSTRVP